MRRKNETPVNGYSGRDGMKKGNMVLFAIGLLAVLFMGLPYVLLGQDAIVVYHDQLDGELIAYLLQAKHLLQGDILPEFLNGAAKTALIPPAPLCVLLFLGGNGYGGLVCMQLLGSVCGYVGMFLLVKEVVKEAAPEATSATGSSVIFITCIAVAVGVLYAYLPFLPVYGLSQYGLPLLLWCLIQARKGSFVKTAYVYGALYALCSSLVLVGFGVLGAMALWAVIRLAGALVQKRRDNTETRDTIERRKNAGSGATETVADSDGKRDVSHGKREVSHGEVQNRKHLKNGNDNIAWKHLAGIWLTMLVIYIVENFSLLKQTLGLEQAGGEISHKTEYVLAPTEFWSGFWQGLTRGGQHSGDYHYLFLLAVLLVAVVCFFAKFGRKMLGIMSRILAWNVFFALVAALWDSAVGIAIRSKLSTLGAFQMNRLLWMAPCLWYLLFACAMVLAAAFLLEHKKDKKHKGMQRIAAGVLCVLVAGGLCATAGKVLLESNLKPNVQKLRNPAYAALSFRDYYAVGVLEQVRDYIQETTGQEQSEYRVVSLGIDPAAALYHGFYCLDGYSNNYSLEYKHAFRNMIEPELSKSEYLRNNFDTWGNRCYLFSAECPGYYTIEKNGFYFQDYSLNTDSLKELGGKYVLSAAYIQNAEETGLHLLREEPFETEGSYYRIFLYEVE